MTLTAKIYNESGEPFTIDFQYEIEGNVVTVKGVIFDEGFGDGWMDDVYSALREILDFDFELKIV